MKIVRATTTRFNPPTTGTVIIGPMSCSPLFVPDVADSRLTDGGAVLVVLEKPDRSIEEAFGQALGILCAAASLDEIAELHAGLEAFVAARRGS